MTLPVIYHTEICSDHVHASQALPAATITWGDCFLLLWCRVGSRYLLIRMNQRSSHLCLLLPCLRAMPGKNSATSVQGLPNLLVFFLGANGTVNTLPVADAWLWDFCFYLWGWFKYFKAGSNQHHVHWGTNRLLQAIETERWARNKLRRLRVD